MRNTGGMRHDCVFCNIKRISIGSLSVFGAQLFERELKGIYFQLIEYSMFFGLFLFGWLYCGW